MKLPATIADRVIEAIASLDPATGGPADRYGVAQRAFPLLADVGGCCLLRPDGEFLQIAWDTSEDSPTVLGTIPLAALVVGAERFPWLRELVPVRSPQAIDCQTCAGTGKIRRGEVSGILCGDCSVLGWVVPDSDPSRPRFEIGQTVTVVLNERNRTPHTGTIRAFMWHHQLQRWHYFLDEDGKAISKRYAAEDLFPVA